MLTADKPLLNYQEGAFMELELTDEFLSKLKALLEKKLEIQAELTRSFLKILDCSNDSSHIERNQRHSTIN